MLDLNTKKDFENALLLMLNPLLSHYSEGGAELDIGAFAAGYGDKIGHLEGFSRVLWGLVPYIAGGKEYDELINIYIKGLTNGTNKNHPEYWGDLNNKSQHMVEMAAISFGILLIPNKLWNGISSEAQDNLANWLYQINDYTQADNNWHFFNVMVNIALKSVHKPYSQSHMKAAMDKYESFYIGNGWYSDGKRPQMDYYISFGFHFYCLLYAEFMKDEEPEKSLLFKARAKEFAQTFIYWFDENGKALPFGRSLTYRFAQSAFWSACVFAHVDAFPLGVMKGIISRNFEYWLSQPIFDNGGILTVGYAYPNLNMAEEYNSPTSPYWAFKAFLILALDGNSEFWKKEALPLPKLKQTKYIPECRMILSHYRNNTVALTSGQYAIMEPCHTPEKYSKFAYSTALGFCIARSAWKLEEAVPDSMLAFKAHDAIWVRRKCEEFTLTDNSIYSKWSPVEGITVETTLIPTETGHIRKHIITSEFDCLAFDCGFSFPHNRLTSKISFENSYSVITDKNGYSKITSAYGTPKFFDCAPNSNIVFPRTYVPYIEYNIKKGTSVFESIVETEIFNSDIDIQNS